MSIELTGKVVSTLRLPTTDYSGTPIRVVAAEQNDVNSRFLRIMMYDDRGNVDKSVYDIVVLQVENSEGTPMAVQGEIKDGFAFVELTPEMLAINSQLTCNLVLGGSNTHGNGFILTSQNFYVYVSRRVHGFGTPEDIENHNILISLIQRVNELESHIQAAESGREAAETARVHNETLRVIAEQLRVDAEALRVQAEQQRENQEAIRQANEIVRQNNEATRQSQEQGRVTAENQRVVAENQRASNENTRQSQEATRQANEVTRQNNETTRQNQEATRQNNEATRVSQEQGRVTAESQRVTAEQGRVIAEDQRISNENQRIENEQNRGTAESERADAEQMREQNEGVRQDQEQARTDAEAQRVESENARITNEQGRDDSEQERVSAESVREQNELTRKDQEGVRVDAEVQRGKNEDERIENELDRIEAERLRREGFDNVVEEARDAAQEVIDSFEGQDNRVRLLSTQMNGGEFQGYILAGEPNKSQTAEQFLSSFALEDFIERVAVVFRQQANLLTDVELLNSDDSPVEPTATMGTGMKVRLTSAEAPTIHFTLGVVVRCDILGHGSPSTSDVSHAAGIRTGNIKGTDLQILAGMRTNGVFDISLLIEFVFGIDGVALTREALYSPDEVSKFIRMLDHVTNDGSELVNLNLASWSGGVSFNLLTDPELEGATDNNAPSAKAAKTYIDNRAVPRMTRARFNELRSASQIPDEMPVVITDETSTGSSGGPRNIVINSQAAWDAMSTHTVKVIDYDLLWQLWDEWFANGMEGPDPYLDPPITNMTVTGFRDVNVEVNCYLHIPAGISYTLTDCRIDFKDNIVSRDFEPSANSWENRPLFHGNGELINICFANAYGPLVHGLSRVIAGAEKWGPYGENGSWAYSAPNINESSQATFKHIGHLTLKTYDVGQRRLFDRPIGLNDDASWSNDFGAVIADCERVDLRGMIVFHFCGLLRCRNVSITNFYLPHNTPLHPDARAFDRCENILLHDGGRDGDPAIWRTNGATQLKSVFHTCGSIDIRARISPCFVDAVYFRCVDITGLKTIHLNPPLQNILTWGPPGILFDECERIDGVIAWASAGHIFRNCIHVTSVEFMRPWGNSSPLANNHRWTGVNTRINVLMCEANADGTYGAAGSSTGIGG